jgi:pimeloyl-ACP methyl ester carboxylesterase
VSPTPHFLSIMLRRLLLLPLLAAHALVAAPDITVETGEIEGAKFTVIRPAQWNRRVLLIAHGLRDPDRPLVADLLPDQLADRTLIEEGWMIAKTSYRRNGIIVADALTDLDGLRDYIERKFGAPERVLLEGESMGGLIVTLLAERDRTGPNPYHGALAIGAALSLQEKGVSVGVSLKPQIPLLFLTNQSELDGPRSYVEASLRRPDLPRECHPVLFRVSRDGHVNVNQRERLIALRALNSWIDEGRDAIPQPRRDAPYVDATVSSEPIPTQVTMLADNRGFETRVVDLAANYGNVALNAQPNDFVTAGIPPGAWFQLIVRGEIYRTRYGKDFSSVKRGDWVVFPSADGFFWLARNFGDAAATAKIVVGDKVTVRRYEDIR